MMILSKSDEEIRKTIAFEIATLQGQIFQESEVMGLDMEDFALCYMQSDFCNNEMDSPHSSFHLCSPAQCMEAFLANTRPIKRSNLERVRKVSGADGWGWSKEAGFYYRLLHFSTSLSSREIYRKIDFVAMHAIAMGLTDWEIPDALKELKEIMNNEQRIYQMRHIFDEM